jgi:TonB-linked SusC/RagA family outer membrane protein
MKSITTACLILFIFSYSAVYAQQMRTIVKNPDNEPIEGASIKSKSGISAISRKDGSFDRSIFPQNDTVTVSHIGYISKKAVIDKWSADINTIVLIPDSKILSEVEISTGYYQVPKERATGAFTQIDNKLINRSVSPNLISRLEGVTNGLLFDRRKLTGENVNGPPELRVRGLSTILADTRPLIVLDNFPFEGDINNINPNDIESVTVLRDAAAASIWGARAGNGVIVINTKQGKFNQPLSVTFTSSLNVGEKPDLFYRQAYLPADMVMSIQKQLFERGTYPINNQTLIPSYVELLIKKRDNLISGNEFDRQQGIMMRSDLRRDASDFLYQRSLAQQYAVNLNGGEKNYRFALSAGLDKNQSNTIGNNSVRNNVSLQNSYKVVKNLEASSSIYYSSQKSRSNGLTLRDIGYSGSSIISNIYDRLKDDNGNAAATGNLYRQAYRENAISQGLLDWMYRPLDEINLTDNNASNNLLRINAGLKYSPIKDLNVNATYQFVDQNSKNEVYYDPDSYYVRNLVNRYTRADGSRAIPYGGIMDYGTFERKYSNSGRLQADYSLVYSNRHRITLLAGAEIRETITNGSPGARLYNFSKDTQIGSAVYDYTSNFVTRPNGSAPIPIGTGQPTLFTDRFLSYFSNMGYTFLERYILSGSIRWDASNLFGVESNKKGTALWSIGTSWEISQESFYPTDSWLHYLRLRSTYGSAGNVDKTQSQYPTITVSTNGITQLPQATLNSPGNRFLKWEQVNTLNLGLDFKSVNNRISGSIEYYYKRAKDLLGSNSLDPTTGIGLTSGYKINYAGLDTKGWDIELNSRNINGILKWESSILISHSENKITRLSAPKQLYAINYINGQIPEQGKSVDLVYALPWNGLSSSDGMPVVYVNGMPTTQASVYEGYILNIPYGQLVNAGTSVPKIFGSVRNTISWKNFQLSAIISFKAGHVFRRTSIGPGQEYLSSPVYHMDYFKRWKQPGDELLTNVPAASQTNVSARSQFYQQSEILITKGDAVRLQDINLIYTMTNGKQRFPFKTAKLYCYLSNLGIIWKANKFGIDPDYFNADYPPPGTVSFGIQLNF